MRHEQQVDDHATVRDSILAAKSEIEAREAAAPVEAAQTPEATVAPSVSQETAIEKPSSDGRDAQGRFVGKQLTGKDLKAPEQPKVEPLDIPDPYKAIKDKYGTLPPEVREFIKNRESEIHKGFTKHDDERNFGKSVKQIVLPYEATIRAEGGTPEKAIQGLLNQAYVMRTGSAQQKAEIVREVIRQYGVDPNMIFSQQAQQQRQQPQFDPNELAARIEENLQQKMIAAKIQEGYQAFVSDQSLAHRENPMVRAAMASLFNGENPPKDYTEAYHRAISDLSSITGSTQQAHATAKPAIDVAAKKAAGKSVTGSPGPAVPNSGAPDRSLREELRANLRQYTS